MINILYNQWLKVGGSVGTPGGTPLQNPDDGWLHQYWGKLDSLDPFWLTFDKSNNVFATSSDISSPQQIRSNHSYHGCRAFVKPFLSGGTFTFSRLRSKSFLFPSLRTAWYLWRGILSVFKMAEGNQMGLWIHRHYPNIDGFDVQSIPNDLQNLFKTWLFSHQKFREWIGLQQSYEENSGFP